MNRTFRSLVGVVLALLLVFTATVPAFAEFYKAEPDEKAALVETFNTAVNSIKTDMPKATVRYNNYVPEGGITTGAPSETDPTRPAGYGEEIDEMAQKYLIPVLEGLFNNRSSLTKSFILTLLGDGSAKPETVTLHAGAPRNNAIPLYGKKTVSELTAADDYDIVYEENDLTGKLTQMGIIFPSVKLEDAKDSSLPKVFSLPSGQLNPTIISGQPTAATARLEGAELRHFTFDNARAVVRFGADGKPNYYGMQIDYNFSLSFYDAMNLISAVIGYNFYEAVLGMISSIMVEVGQQGIEAESIMRDMSLFITYRCITEVSNIDYFARWFGDVDDDGDVSAADARAALRHAVGVELIASSNDLIYTDMDFDGDITAADARMILRTAVGLETKFNVPPEGKDIRIARTEDPIDEVPDEEEIEQEQQVYKGILGDWTPTVTLRDIGDEIVAIVHSFMDTAGEGQNLITELIAAIQEAVKEGKTKPKP